ncbi:MAG: hypothetical protein ACLU5G_00335, partial [Blautia sp.]
GDAGAQGPTGPQGVQGETGATGARGEKGEKGDTGIQGTAGSQGVQGEMGPTGPTGPMGPQGTTGVTGPTGPRGESGDTGATGATPTVVVGNVASGDRASVVANPTVDGISLDFVLPAGATGPQGEKGDNGIQGVQGVQGNTGPQGVQGVAGETPQITVEQNTKTGYKVRFRTSTQDIVSPNLKSNTEYYNMNLAATGSTASIPLENLVLVVRNTSSTSLRLSIQPLTAGTSVLADIRRVSIYDSSIDAQTNNNVTISTSLLLDDIVYSMSQEMHWMRIRQQNPSTKLWSLCEVRTFASQNGSRTSIWVEWIYTESTFTAP